MYTMLCNVCKQTELALSTILIISFQTQIIIRALVHIVEPITLTEPTRRDARQVSTTITRDVHLCHLIVI